MLKRPRTDFWQVGIVPLAIQDANAARLQAARRQTYADLAARIAFTSLADGSRTILIAPASGRESSDEVALGLAQALGMLGRRVLLIEADICAQRTSARESDEPSGLTAVLTGRSSFERELSDPSLSWQRWMRTGYAPFELPAPGQAVLLPRAALGALLFSS